MSKALIILLATCAIFMIFGPVWPASDGALKLRALNDLTEFAPPEAFLNGNFVADEIEPHYVFGKVKDFLKSRSCPTQWLIEKSERDRIKNQDNRSGPMEYTFYLEEDCPGKVMYYVFVDRAGDQSAQWMQWRRMFHKSTAEPQYGAAGALLEQAARRGFPVDGELRFIEIGGDLISKKPEDFLTGDLKISPIFDLRQGKAVAK